MVLDLGSIEAPEGPWTPKLKLYTKCEEWIHFSGKWLYSFNYMFKGLHDPLSFKKPDSKTKFRWFLENSLPFESSLSPFCVVSREATKQLFFFGGGEPSCTSRAASLCPSVHLEPPSRVDRVHADLNDLDCIIPSEKALSGTYFPSAPRSILRNRFYV